MSKEDNLAVVHRWAEAINSGDLEAAVSNLAPDYLGYFSAMPEPVRGREGFKQVYSSFIRPAFPDQQIVIEQELASGDRVAAQTRWTATHQGPFVGLPATGRKVSVAGTAIFRIADGLIAEEWIQEDFLGIYQQLTQASS